MGWIRNIAVAKTMSALVLTLLLCVDVSAQTPMSEPQEIRLGMSTALSGPAADLGRNVRKGVEVAVAELRNTWDRPITLYVLDDGYEPDRTIPNMRQLIENNNVHVIIGNVGTPTSVVSLPIIRDANIAFFGAYTGAGILRRDPPDRVVFNYRASYAQETTAMVHGLIKDGGLSPDDIAFFTQRDAYGDSGYNGAIEAMKEYGLKNDARVIHARYDRNTLCVEQAVIQMIMADRIPKAIIMIGAYAPCAKFIKLVRESGVNPIFLNVSFVGTESLIKALGDHGEGVIVTQVVPHVMSDLPLVEAYRKAMQSYAPDEALGTGSLEGYIDMVILHRALASITGTVTRESIITALGNMGTFDIGLGTSLSFSNSDHQASDCIWPMMIRQQQAQPFDWSALRQLMANKEHGRMNE